MNHSQAKRSESSFALLRSLSRPQPAAEKCELCSVVLESGHRHLLEMSSRKVVCACDPCALRFQLVVDGRFKLIPRDPRALPDFRMTDAQWEGLALPINLAFLFHSTHAAKTIALYPSPAGAVESLSPLSSWATLVAENPVLEQMEPDVEALLINRVGESRRHFVSPIDACYELAGLIRVHWRGLSGGEEVWQHIEAFFENLQVRSGLEQEATHA